MEEKIIDSISIVTFISNKEKFNMEIFKFYNDIRKFCGFAEFIIFSDVALFDSEKIYGDNIYEKVCPNMTKYKRILLSLSIVRSDKILFLDNDISPDNKNLYNFLKAYRNESDLYFGKIGVNNPQNLIEKLIKIDKNISHKFTRPILWKFKIGISVPGQIFMINKNRFVKDLNHRDTVFDDLFIGICAKENKYIVQRSTLMLGYEKASNNISILLRQRIRWAKGYYQTLLFHSKIKVFPLIIIHGIAYHFTIIIIDILLSFVVFVVVSLLFLRFGVSGS